MIDFTNAFKKEEGFSFKVPGFDISWNSSEPDRLLIGLGITAFVAVAVGGPIALRKLTDNSKDKEDTEE